MVCLMFLDSSFFIIYIWYNLNNYYTNSHEKLNKKIQFYGIPDHKGVPIDVKVTSIINKPNGIFIDVGAFDGIKDSSTLHLETYRNWIGILITPDKELAKKCKNISQLF